MNLSEKSRVAKLLNDLEVVEHKLPERCTPIVEEFRKKIKVENDSEKKAEKGDETITNPYIPNQAQLDEIDRKIMKTILPQKKEAQQASSSQSGSFPDPKRPWRIYTYKEKLLRIDNQLKRHHEKSSELITPLTEDEIEALMKCDDPPANTNEMDQVRLQETIELAKKSLPNFQYRKSVGRQLT